MNAIVPVINKLSRVFNTPEMLIYCYILENNQNFENEIYLKFLFNIINKNKTIDILKLLASKKIIVGTITGDILTLSKILGPEEVLNSTLESVITEGSVRGGSRLANSAEVREVILKLVPEKEEHVARKIIRKLISICNELNITNRALDVYLKEEISKGVYWKEIISSYNVRSYFDKKSLEEIV